MECSILDFVQYLNMFLFACPPDSTSIGNNRENTCIVEEAEVVVVVATTRHSRTNDLTMSKALQWAIK